MKTNFAREFKLYESLFSENTLNENKITALKEELVQDVKDLLSKTPSEINTFITEDVVDSIFDAMYKADDPDETDLSNFETILFKSTGNGNYLVKKEDLATVEKVEVLTNVIYDFNNTFAGYEIFTYLLSILNIPFQYNFEY